MLGKSEGRRRMGQQNEMVGWHHWLKTPGSSEEEGILACCSPCGCRETWLDGWTKITKEAKSGECTLLIPRGAMISSCPTATDAEISFLHQWGELGEERGPWGKSLLRMEGKGTVRGKLGSTDGSGLWIKPHFNLRPPRVFSSVSQGIPFVLF